MVIDDTEVIPRRAWDFLVRYRDGSCAECDSDTDLVAHHMDENKLNNTLANGMTLCRSCHARWHKMNLSPEERARAGAHWKGKKRGPWPEDRKREWSRRCMGREPWNKGQSLPPREPMPCPTCEKICSGKQGLAIHLRHCG